VKTDSGFDRKDVDAFVSVAADDEILLLLMTDVIIGFLMPSGN
jgi:hypothetical protein